MKKIIIAAIMLLAVSEVTSAQWYVRKYNVDDIRLLTNDQLKESLDRSKENLFLSAGLGVAGGLMIWLGEYTLKHGIDEDASFLKQVLGAEIMGKGYIVLGACGATGGTIASLICFGRYEKIRSVIKKNYEPQGSLKISPAVIFQSDSRSPAIGFSLHLNF